MQFERTTPRCLRKLLSGVSLVDVVDETAEVSASGREEEGVVDEDSTGLLRDDGDDNGLNSSKNTPLSFVTNLYSKVPSLKVCALVI